MNQSRVVVGALGVALMFVGLVWAPRTAAGAGGGGAGGGTGGGTGDHMGAGVKVTAKPHTVVATRKTDQEPYWVSYKDCTGGAELPFSVVLNLATPAGGQAVSSFEVWLAPGLSGTTNCANPTVRATSCIQLYQEAVSAGTSHTSTPSFRAKEDIVMKGLNFTDGCDHPLPSDSIPITLWFILVRDKSMTADSDDYTTYTDTEVDLVGPDAPTDVKLTAKAQSVEVVFTESDSDAKSFLVYRDPPGTSASGATGGGGAGGSGTTGSGTTGTCASQLLSAGTIPADNIPVAEESASKSVQVSDLEDGVTYAVAVAGVDVVGNIGKLSEVKCATPEPVESFFKKYCQDGGHACVSGCGVSTLGSADMLFWPALSSLALGVAVLRRRRRAPEVG
jgi:hypothetical protein